MSVENSDISKNGFKQISKYRGAIMGFAALSILFFHAWIPITLEPDESKIYLISFLEHYFKKIGFLGVDIFFLLSGIGLTFSIKKGSTLKFYYRRIRRIILPFFAVGIIRGIIQNWGIATIIGNLSGYNFYTKDVNSFLWFIPAIITLYLIFPLYYRIFCRFNNKVLFTIIVITIWLIVSLIVSDTMRKDLFGFTNRIPIFVIGILFGFIMQNKKEIVFNFKIYLLLAIVLLTGFYLAYLTTIQGMELIVPIGNCFLPNLLIATSLSFLLAKLFDMLERRLPKTGKIVNKTLGFFGMISLELYCVQSWFVDIIELLLNDGWSKHIINISLFLIVTATSWVAYVVFRSFWELVEIPFKHHKT